MDVQAEELAEIFSIFSNEKRLKIFWSLDEAEKSVNEIAEAIDSSMQNTSQHLRLMKAQNILASRRNGQSIYYGIADGKVADFCRMLLLEKIKEDVEEINQDADNAEFPIGENLRTVV